jgi:UDP-glucose 4-epimerase
MSRTRTLITGGSGFIASHLRELYPEADCIDEQYGQDICDGLPAKSYDQIFHLAAKHHIPTCEVQARRCIEVNCWGTLNLIKTYPNARIISISSSAANEVKSVYGASKLFTEIIGPLHKNYLSVRLYNVFGEGQRVEGGAVVPKLVSSFVKNLPLSIYGDGTQARDLTYVGDVVHNLRLLMDSDLTGLTHLGYGEPISINDLIKMIYGYMPEVKHEEARGVDILFSKSPVPCSILYGREEGIRRTIEWHRQENFV